MVKWKLGQKNTENHNFWRENYLDTKNSVKKLLKCVGWVLFHFQKKKEKKKEKLPLNYDIKATEHWQ